MNNKNDNQPKFRDQIQERTLAYITAAFGLVAGLAWNDAIKALIEQVVPLGRSTVLAKFIYAGGVTVVAVILTVYLMQFFRGIDRESTDGEKSEGENIDNVNMPESSEEGRFKNES